MVNVGSHLDFVSALADLLTRSSLRSQKEQSKKYNTLVDAAPQLIQDLPWGKDFEGESSRSFSVSALADVDLVQSPPSNDPTSPHSRSFRSQREEFLQVSPSTSRPFITTDLSRLDSLRHQHPQLPFVAPSPFLTSF